MSWKIGMPNLGHTMEEGKVSEWLKQVGEPVRQGEVIAVVESDKASFDVDCPADGVLLAIHAQPGTVVPVGQAIGEVGAPGERLAAAAPASAAPAALAAASVAATVPAPAAAAGRAAGRVRISPAARALAEELGVDPAEVTATGEDGMVTRDDVRAHAQAARAAPPAPAAPASSSTPSRKGRIRPLSAMRRAIADATTRAWQAVPHVPLHSRADVGLLQQRGLPLTAAIARACALALEAHPSFNGWLIEQGFQQAGDVNLAVAVSTGEGLVTAVMPQAQTLSVAQLQAQMQSLAHSARAGTLDGQHMLGGTFTLSSLGRWGVDAFVPLIAAPQVAILGVGRVNRVAREAEGGGLRFASEMALTLVFDHRANDGVQAAQLLAAIVAHLENPQTLEMTP